MSTIKRILFGAFMAAALSAQAAHLVVAPVDFQGAAYTNRVVVLTPTEARGELPYIYTIEPRKQTVTDGSGVTFSNTFAGTYKLEISGSPYTSLRLLVPDTNGLVNAVSCIVVSTNAVEASAAWAWSAAASDARYAATGESGSGSGETIDAGSVPAEERLRFPIGGGLYARATVHPNALWLPTNWNGAQIWLAFTGTTNQSATAFGTDTEDPFIYASADGGNTWTLKSAAPLLSKADSQTIAGWSSSGWQADTEIYLDTNGVMRLIWMGYHPYSGSFSNVLFHSQSTDGTNWSTPTVLRKWASDAGNAWSTNAAMAGPQVVAMPQGLRLYWVDDGNYGTNASGVGTNSLWYAPALDGSGTNWDWASANRCTLSPYLTNNSAPWHFDIALVGSNRWYLQYGSQASSFGEYSTSTNGVNWSPPGMGLFLSADLKQRPEEYGFYKSTWSPVPGANVPTFNAILGHTPLTQANVEGWNFSLVRGLVPDPLGLVYTGANTNGLLLGGNALYGGVGRLGGLTVVDNFHGSSSGKVALGQPFNGWGGIAMGYNSPMASTNYVLASDGLTETRLNARGSGSVNIAVNNTVKATVTSSNATVHVPITLTNTAIYAPFAVHDLDEGISNVLKVSFANGVTSSVGFSGQMAGDGSGLTSLRADQVTGALTNVGNITASGTITGDGRGLTNLPMAVQSIVSYGAIGDGITDNTAAFAAGFAAGGFYVPSGAFVCGNLTVTNAATVYGAGGSVVFLNTTTNVMWDCLRANVSLQNVVLNGGNTVTNQNFSTRHGVLMSTTNGGTVLDCIVKGFSGAGVAFDGAYSPFNIGNTPKVVGGSLFYNGAGVAAPLFTLGGEYTKVIGVNIFSNYIGAWLNAGNVLVSDSHFTGNKIALSLGSTGNGGHCAVSDSTFNHNHTNLVATGLQFGERFDSCLWLFGEMVITGCTNITFDGGMFGGNNWRLTNNLNCWVVNGGDLYNSLTGYFTNNPGMGWQNYRWSDGSTPGMVTGNLVATNISSTGTYISGDNALTYVRLSSAAGSYLNWSASNYVAVAGGFTTIRANGTDMLKVTTTGVASRGIVAVNSNNIPTAAQIYSLLGGPGSVLGSITNSAVILTVNGGTNFSSNLTLGATLTAGNVVASAANTATPSFKAAGTNNMILLAPDGGRWILKVDNAGNLTTVTNSSGL